jgi:hypothetical protein
VQLDRPFHEAADCPGIAQRMKQAADLRRYHFAKDLDNRPGELRR